MNKRNLFITIALMIVAATVVFVSCKKETENALIQRGNSTRRTIDISQIDDMTAYFKEFRLKMTESKSDETLNIEDAAWHLACMANYDFCRVNVEYNDFRFDTIEMQVNVTNGNILMSDLNLAYEQMCTEIQQFKKGFNHNNENLYFINMFINDNGNVKITIKTTFVSNTRGLEDHLWYFPDTFCYIDSVCDYYFTSDSTYLWNTTARSELERILNLFEHHENQPGIICYAPTRSYTFEYPNWIDSYGSEFNCNSRLFAELSYEYNLIYNLPLDEMCYCLDSYLGLGYDYIEDYYYVDNELPLNWIVIDTTVRFDQQKQYSCYHNLKVEYGRRWGVKPPLPDPD
ncbi:MAG: hypothetical protein IKH44_04320 [Bacteroidales bacterium]|nr:hypothetical protein [Bacteroidales bacterium]